MPHIFDMHCHLNFSDDCEHIAKQAHNSIEAINATVSPKEFECAKKQLGGYSNIHVALGLHPWEINASRISECELLSFEKALNETNIVSEIGLDFASIKRLAAQERNDVKEQQISIFERLIHLINETNNKKIVFLHAVKCYEHLFDIINKENLASSHLCVLHAFCGSLDEVKRAISLGCAFSIGLRTLSNEKGCEAAARIPDNLLLIETDAPRYLGSEWSYEQWVCTLEKTLDKLAEIRQTPKERLAETIYENSRKLINEFCNKPLSNAT